MAVVDAFAKAAELFASDSDLDWEPLDHQVPPPATDPWYVWLMLGGRGAGKTEAASRYVSRYMRRHPGTRLAIIAPTLGDARMACIYGPSGLKAHDPELHIVKSPDFELRWPNGSTGHIFGAHSPEDVERLRAGGNRHLVWAEELAAWRHLQDAWDQMEFGLRLGDRPHVVSSTTPKNRPLIRDLVERDDVVISRASTDDNPHLHGKVRERLYARYKGTRLGRQELNAEILDDNENALWKLEAIERDRVTPEDYWAWAELDAVRLDRLVVAVDPAVTAKKTSDDTGIVTVGRVRGECLCGDGEDHGFVLRDDTEVAAKPAVWAKTVASVYHEMEADFVIGEVNNGGDLVEHTVHTEDDTVTFRQVRASRGKVVRAEPVAALYEQHRVHHVGRFDLLEDQMVTWEPGLTKDSPDRVDALVWGLTSVMLGRKRQGYVAPVVEDSVSYWREGLSV